MLEIFLPVLSSVASQAATRVRPPFPSSSVDRLEHRFGLRGVCRGLLSWPGSRRTCLINVFTYDSSMSSVDFIVCSVPSGSVLGPRLFVLYIANQADVIHQHDVKLHAYADDS